MKEFLHRLVLHKGKAKKVSKIKIIDFNFLKSMIQTLMNYFNQES